MIMIDHKQYFKFTTYALFFSFKLNQFIFSTIFENCVFFFLILPSVLSLISLKKTNQTQEVKKHFTTTKKIAKQTIEHHV